MGGWGGLIMLMAGAQVLGVSVVGGCYVTFMAGTHVSGVWSLGALSTATHAR